MCFYHFLLLRERKATYLMRVLNKSIYVLKKKVVKLIKFHSGTWWSSIYFNRDNISGHITQHCRPDNICGFLFKASVVFHQIFKSLQTQHDPASLSTPPPPQSHTISYWSKKHLISLTMMYYLLKKRKKKPQQQMMHLKLLFLPPSVGSIHSLVHIATST